MNKLKITDFKDYKFLSQLSLSPDGKQLALILAEMDLENNCYKKSIFLAQLKNNKFLQVSRDKEDKKLVWLDQDNLLVLRDKTGNKKGTSLVKINIKEESSQEILKLEENIRDFKIIDKDRILLLMDYKNKDKLNPEDKYQEDYLVFDELPFWSNGEGYRNKIRKRLYLYTLTNKKLIPLTEELEDIKFFKLDAENKNLLIVSNNYKDKLSLGGELSLINLAKLSRKSFGYKEFNYKYLDFLEDKIIILGSFMKRDGLNENPHFYRMNLDGSDFRQISPNSFDKSCNSSLGSDCRYGSNRIFKVDGPYLYFLTTDNFSSNLNRINLRGEIEQLSLDNGSIDGFDVVDHKIYFTGLRNFHLGEVYRLENKREVQISNFNKTALENKKLSKPNYLSLAKLDNNIEGWVIKPVDFKEGKKYPAILNIHGGPKTVFGEVFFHEMQVMAARGYFVIYCNPRGSDGKGNDFANIRGRYGSIDYEDLMDFLDLALESYPDIDQNNLGVTGGSYGGFMTNWIIGQTNRFKAAVSQRSISNWFSFMGTTDIGYYFTEDQQSSNPWDNPKKLWSHSPLKYAHQVVTPTLFIHAMEDYRCWLPEAMQMFTGLKYHGIDSRLCIFKGENHELSRSGLPQHRKRRLEEILGWFDKYLKES